MNIKTTAAPKKSTLSKHALRQACSYEILIPEEGNYTPPSRTPWGGKEIPRQMKQKRRVGFSTEEEKIVGESWEISGHPSFPNTFQIAGEKVAIAELEEQASDLLYGSKTQQMPILIKLLNSGSWTPHRQRLQALLVQYDKEELPKAWVEILAVSRLSRIVDGHNGLLHERIKKILSLLEEPGCPATLANLHSPLEELHQKMLTSNLSIQVHPKRGQSGSKSEAWTILDAEPGAGLYLGLAQGVTKAHFEKALEKEEDISALMHFVEVRAGETFFLPSGTPHAIGGGILLLEPQECSETTYRVYDWDREVDGKKREMHPQEAMKSINFRSARGDALAKQLVRRPRRIKTGGNGLASVESLVQEKEFSLKRITFGEEGDEFLHEESFAAFTIVKGSIRIFIPEKEAVYTLQKGESFLTPAALNQAVITGCKTGSVLMMVEPG